mmetsp:Transcript_10698/g.27419  ORF Transcript_10698/g.27419 Transcript_10698/m.27419 type:complete len:230 (+) Transcript_10698:188-877(+)
MPHALLMPRPRRCRGAQNLLDLVLRAHHVPTAEHAQRVRIEWCHSRQWHGGGPAVVELRSHTRVNGVKLLQERLRVLRCDDEQLAQPIAARDTQVRVGENLDVEKARDAPLRIGEVGKHLRPQRRVEDLRQPRPLHHRNLVRLIGYAKKVAEWCGEVMQIVCVVIECERPRNIPSQQRRDRCAIGSAAIQQHVILSARRPAREHASQKLEEDAGLEDASRPEGGRVRSC